MGNLFYDLQTNITTQKEDIFPTCVDHLIFQTADGNYLEIESQGKDEFTHENGHLSGHWQDHVMYRRLDACFNLLPDDEFHNIDDRDIVFEKLISDPATKLIGFRVDEESLGEHGYGPSFVPECSEASVAIDFINSKGTDVLYRSFKATDLLTDEQIEAAIRSSLGKGGN